MACKYIYKGTTYTKEEFESFVKENLVKKSPENQFLQLLNKDNNWVTFFVKSIIQDSAKKGYEKVLFPLGDTASKIEGHETLEEFKKQKEDRIKELENTQLKYYAEELSNDWEPVGNITNYYNTQKEAEEAGSKEYTNYTIGQTDGFDNSIEISQLKQELERVETEGFAALRPIYNFYQNTVTNILKKQGYEIKEVTDEYGNKWNEISVNQTRDLKNILLQKNEANRIIGQANIRAMEVMFDPQFEKSDGETRYHEYAHHYIAWFRNHPLVQEGIKKWGSEEALVQAIGEQSVKQKGEAWNWWKKFFNFLQESIKNLSKKDKEEIKNILTDAFLSRADLENGHNELTSERIRDLAQKASGGVFNQIKYSPLNPKIENIKLNC